MTRKEFRANNARLYVAIGKHYEERRSEMGLLRRFLSPQSWWLNAAAIYNVLWGASVVLFPQWFFIMAGMEMPRYPEIWQCIGMIVGVYGIGYAIAADNPVKHWPIVLVGLLGKIAGPIGFIGAVADGSFTMLAGLTIITNDLIWWIPFGCLLWSAWKEHQISKHAEASD